MTTSKWYPVGGGVGEPHWIQRIHYYGAMNAKWIVENHRTDTGETWYRDRFGPVEKGSARSILDDLGIAI